MKILLVGAGGYALGYVKALLENQNSDVIFEGVVDPYFSSCEKKKEIEERKIPVYSTMEDFYNEHEADLAIISTPPFLHCEQSVHALSKGSYVLCEKPIAPTVEDAEAMIEAEKKYGRWIAIGYQWSFSSAIQRLKNDVLSGTLGKPLSFKTIISAPRDLSYYKRGSGWAGRISKDGKAILDSIASNACAHYLNNMLFLLGDTADTSAEASELEGSCFRANNIENFDTCSLKIKAKGVPLYFIASHAAKDKITPEFIYKFENATVRFSKKISPNIIATWHNGGAKDYGDPFENQFGKIWSCVDAIKAGTTPICTAKTSIAHTKLIEKVYREIPILDFPLETVVFDKEADKIFVNGLSDRMYLAYENEELLSF